MIVLSITIHLQRARQTCVATLHLGGVGTAVSPTHDAIDILRLGLPSTSPSTLSLSLSLSLLSLSPSERLRVCGVFFTTIDHMLHSCGATH